MTQGTGGRPRQDVLAELERGLDMVVTGLGDARFLDERDAPSRADLAAASLLAQAGFRGTMPEVLAMVEARPPLRPYIARVFEACGAERPRWLAA